MPIPIPPEPTKRNSIYTYILVDNSAKVFEGPPGLTSTGVTVNLDGRNVPKDDPVYPWKFVAGEGIRFTGTEEDDTPPPTYGSLDVGRTTFVNFDKTWFPQGYHTDAKVLNRVFTDSFYQYLELTDGADNAWDNWAAAGILPPPR